MIMLYKINILLKNAFTSFITLFVKTVFVMFFNNEKYKYISGTFTPLSI